jgi:hypothetical protein
MTERPLAKQSGEDFAVGDRVSSALVRFSTHFKVVWIISPTLCYYLR